MGPSSEPSTYKVEFGANLVYSVMNFVGYDYRRERVETELLDAHIDEDLIANSGDH
jgi:hypothetical protein